MPASIQYLAQSRAFRLVAVVMFTPLSLMPNSTIQHPVHWQEAENFIHASLEGGGAVSIKQPASGGKSSSGTIFVQAGGSLGYDLDLQEQIPGAKLIIRYARLHFRENMPPAKFMLTMSTGSSVLNQVFECGNTGGWGTLKADEWDYLHIPLDVDLAPGPVELEITSMEDNCNVNFDGFLISPVAFKLDRGETQSLERVLFSSSGYWGLSIAGDTALPNVFEGFKIVSRSFQPRSSWVSVELVDEEGNVIPVPAGAPAGNKPFQADIQVPASAFASVPDGFYQLKISLGDAGDSLQFPLAVMRELVDRVLTRISGFASLLDDFKASGNALERAFVSDLEHAADYLENTILLLEARQKGTSTTSRETAALAYFERSRARTATDFAEDMEALISQTETSLSRIADNLDPYVGRTGDFRRAFRSKATGKLEPYRIFIPPAYGDMKSIPMLLMLHGGGGDENYHPDLDDGDALKILSKRPHVMLSPRCTSWYEGPGLENLVQLIRETLKNYPAIDPERIYSTGVSRGGWGSFHLALHDPDLLAGIACVSSAPEISPDIEKIRNLPKLFINGGADAVVNPDRARRMSARLDKLQVPHKLVIYPKAGHEYNTREYLNLSLDFFEKH